MEKTKLSFKEIILVAMTLFGMFFGAGNLIFPVHLGQLAGKNTPAAILGFIITAVTIPILSVAAIGMTHSSGLQDLADKIGKKYSVFFTSLLYLTIGPFFAIPRCCTTSFTTGIDPLLGGDGSSKVPLLIFSLCFFALVMFFSLKPHDITRWIGKIINPVFLAFFAILIFSAIFRPTASISTVEPAAGYDTSAFFSSLVEGYGTMDAIAGLAFGIIVVNIVKSMGVHKDSAVAKNVMMAGVFAGLLMGLIYILTIIMGAQSRGAFEISDNGGIALAQISEYYLGRAGSVILAITITAACLKTSIGLVTSCSEAFSAMFHGKIKYGTLAVIFTVFSFAVSNVGLSSIINWSVPALMLIYPPAIVLILLALFQKRFEGSRCVYVTVTAFTWFAAIFDFMKTLPQNIIDGLNLEPVIDFGRNILPFFDINLGWVVPAMIGLVLGLVLKRKSKKA